MFVWYKLAGFLAVFDSFFTIFYTHSGRTVGKVVLLGKVVLILLGFFSVRASVKLGMFFTHSCCFHQFQMRCSISQQKERKRHLQLKKTIFMNQYFNKSKS
jgi:hypothetical protein